ncbi:long-chain fatty acid--CoA ligase [Microbispora cellulosiformans]|uniref:Long-chain fatty acid--CoA ligase n=1 Tax=Microbispora cellulosiformans TaxID=2614688 RepID=A0A5J5JX22_9ACTN|nr:AMP-binding protein [Microbispora cellulosiformans]KAA9375932.1 long-chain fatty acid--CoA ligase [Microbispora cellulosiformans]
MFVDSLVDKLAEHPAQRMRFVARDRTTLVKTYGEIHDDAVRLMDELRDSGLGPGDLVGVFGPNSYEWILADLALLALGCVPVAIPAENRHESADIGAFVERFRLAALLVTRPLPGEAGLPAATAVLSERPVKLGPARHDDVPALPPGVRTIAFSSGTAGTQKGLMLTDDGIANTVELSARAWRVTTDDDILIVMPYSNFQQRYLTYLAISTGCAATVVPPEIMFQALKVVEPTIILGPPSFFEVLYNRVMAADPAERMDKGRGWLSMYGSRVRLMYTGSAPVPPAMVALFQELGAPLYEIYGSTEIGWIAMNVPGAARAGTAGRPVDGVTVELGDGGEVVVRAERPQVAGYVYEGVETQDAVFRPDGRIVTGDLGVLEDGFLRLAGRKNNVIITRSGVKINPAELEAGIERAFPGVRAMVALPDGAALLACVVWLDDPGKAAEVEAHITRMNADHEPSHRIATTLVRPAEELTVESGLLTRNFKIDRSAVRRTVWTSGDR